MVNLMVNDTLSHFEMVKEGLGESSFPSKNLCQLGNWVIIPKSAWSF